LVSEGINLPRKLFNPKKSVVILLILLFNFNCIPADAQQPLPRESGFAGYVAVLGAYISTNSQLNTDGKNKQTDSLDKSGERLGKIRPFPLGLISYTWAEIRTQLYLGVLPENIAAGQFQVETGLRHDLTSGTSLRAAFIPVTPLKQKTWEDPFVVGQDRDRTDINSYGIELAAENILGSGFSFKYDWARQRINNERSGEFLLSQPGSTLLPADLAALDRDADYHRLTTEYSYRVAPRLRLKPILKYSRGNADGDANSLQELAPQLSFLYVGDQLQATLNASIRGAWYDETHPVFEKTRRDYDFSLFAILGYKEPFGWRDFRVDWFSGAFRQTSNINFYESNSFLTALGLGYEF
jgi:hypothetical protein